MGVTYGRMLSCLCTEGLSSALSPLIDERGNLNVFFVFDGKLPYIVWHEKI